MKYGSDYSRTWARMIRFGHVGAKAVLMAICNYVDEEGAAVPSLTTLAEDTDQSEDSVRRRLKDLEEWGVLVRLARFVDSNGKANTRGVGRRTTDEIRLLFQATQATVDEAKALLSGESDSEISPSNLQGSAEQPASGNLQGSDPGNLQGRPGTVATPVDSEPKEEDSPPTPLTGGNAPDLDGWEEFERTFTSDGTPITRYSLGQQLFGALKVDERNLVTRAADGYNRWRKSQRRPPTKLGVQTFLRERGSWEKFAALAGTTIGGEPVGIRPRAAPFGKGWWWLNWDFRARFADQLAKRESPAVQHLRSRVSLAEGRIGWALGDYQGAPMELADLEAKAADLVAVPIDGEVAAMLREHSHRTSPWAPFPEPDVAQWIFAPAALIDELDRAKEREPNPEPHQDAEAEA